MRRALASLALAASLGLCGALVPSLARAVEAPTTTEVQVRELLAEAVKEYQVGKLDRAAIRLRDALKIEVEESKGQELAYHFYLAVGDELWAAMDGRDELRAVMRDWRRRAWFYQQRLRRSDEWIGFLIEKLEKTEEERLVATHELVAVGPIAVPAILKRMVDNREDAQRTNCRVVLTYMGPRAVLPLIEALNSSDERTVASCATVLADLGDSRALPKLQLLVEDTTKSETIRAVAGKSVAAIQAAMSRVMIDVAGGAPAEGTATTAALSWRTRLATAADGSVIIPPASQLYFEEAMRYFRDGDQVRAEMIAAESLRWKWDDASGLSYQRVPGYAWNELMAEELLFDGAAAHPEMTGYLPLLAADLAAQQVEVDLRLRLAGQRVLAPEAGYEMAEALNERMTALAEFPGRVRAVGPANVLRAVQQAIVSERYDVAVYLMRLLEDKELTDADLTLPTKEDGLAAGKPGAVLVAALDHPEKRVRYQAAITLAHLDPKLSFFNAEKVIPLLAEAVGEWGMRTVLVVDGDYRYRNAARDGLLSKGYIVYTAKDGFEAMARLREAPVKDAIIIAGDMYSGLLDEHGEVVDRVEQTAPTLVDALKADPSTEKTPIFISLPENPEGSAKIQTLFEGKVAGFMKKPHDPLELSEKVKAALGDNALPDINRAEREDVCLRACLAIYAIDDLRSQFKVGDPAVVQALSAAIADRADPIRIAALRALGKTRDKAAITRVTDVYRQQDTVLPSTDENNVRAAFLYAIGLLDPTTPEAQDILKAALKHENLGVRTAAWEAISHAPGAENPFYWQYQVQERLDVRTPGAGPDPLTAPAQ